MKLVLKTEFCKPYSKKIEITALNLMQTCTLIYKNTLLNDGREILQRAVQDY